MTQLKDAQEIWQYLLACVLNNQQRTAVQGMEGRMLVDDNRGVAAGSPADLFDGAC
jgi:hypothetical protein